MHLSLCLNILCLTVTPSEDVEAKIKIGSFNLWRQSDDGVLSTIANEIKNEFVEAPDVIAVQEVIYRNERASIDPIATSLGYHFYGKPRWSDNEGVGILSKQPFQFTDELQHEAIAECFLNCMGRVSVMGEYWDAELGVVRIVTSHLSSKKNEAEIRSAQIDEVLGWLKKRDQIQPAAITFWAGDFNAAWSAPELKDIHAPDENSIFKFLNFNTTQSTWGLEPRMTRRLDHIFVTSKRWEPKLEEESIHFRPNSKGSRVLSDHGLLLHSYLVNPSKEI